MPRLKTRPPTYCLHKASGQAIVTIKGKDHYLGRHGTDSSRANYKKLIAEWAAIGAEVPPPASSASAIRLDFRVVELIGPYLEFAETYYTKHGKPTGEYANMKDAVRPVVELYGRGRVAEFGPRALKAVREQMIECGLSRRVINSRVNRIRRVFKWGVENEFVDVGILHALQTVSPLRKGRTTV